MKVSNLIMQDMILSELESGDRESVLKELVEFLKQKQKITKDKELYAKLLQREDLGSTAIGEGVAIPHCKLRSLSNPIVMLAVSRKGVNFHSPDDQPTHIFFLVVSSLDNPSLSLQILAAIAHLVRKADTLIKRILEARNIGTILDVIRQEEEKLD